MHIHLTSFTLASPIRPEKTTWRASGGSPACMAPAKRPQPAHRRAAVWVVIFTIEIDLSIIATWSAHEAIASGMGASHARD